MNFGSSKEQALMSNKIQILLLLYNLWGGAKTTDDHFVKGERIMNVTSKQISYQEIHEI